MVQVDKKFTDNQVKASIKRYMKKEIERGHIHEVLAIEKTRFFALIIEYPQNPSEFSIQTTRKTKTRKIPHCVEDNIMSQLQIEMNLIQDPEIRLRHCNLRYDKDPLETESN